MMKQSEFCAAVRSILDSRLASEQPVPMTWLVREFTVQHPVPEGPDHDLHTLCLYEHTRDTVREEFRKMRKDEDAGQTEFEGGAFKHIQQRYTIDLGEGEPMAVPLSQMTPALCRKKAQELRRMAEGNMAHADELEQLALMLESQAA